MVLKIVAFLSEKCHEDISLEYEIAGKKGTVYSAAGSNKKKNCVHVHILVHVHVCVCVHVQVNVRIHVHLSEHILLILVNVFVHMHVRPACSR